MTVELNQITKQVGAETHIYKTTLSLADTGFNVLLGATGAGKTTLMKIMAGLESPTTGTVTMDGEDVTRLTPQKRQVSFVHQFFVNYPNMTVYENIASPLKLAGESRDAIDAKVREAAELLQIAAMLDRRPSELSGGQQQRTALARAIVKDSRLVLLDEPLANLDYKLREELREQLPKLFEGRGTTVVYATSEPHEALLLGGHTATMREGRVTQFGPTASAYRKPETLETARVFSDPPINVGGVRKDGNTIAMGDDTWPARGAIADAPDGAYSVAVRPHNVTPHAQAEGAVPLEGTVLVTELSGSESVAHFDLDGETWVSQSHGVHPYEVGEPHTFYVDPSAALYYDADGRLVAA